MATLVRAEFDGALGARIVTRRPLLYENGPDTREDRPGHVRAGSGLVRFGTGLAVVQDDADFVALIDSRTGVVRPVALPRRGSGARQFDEGRGNKAEKLDFEACVVAPLRAGETLVAFGSGSTPAREALLVLRLDEEARVVHAPDLYAALRRETEFSGSELNVEGAILDGGVLRLFQRGNGAPRGGLLPVNATCDVAWSYIEELIDGRRSRVAPRLDAVTQFDLGGVDGVPLTFTDAALTDSGDVVYIAAAEESPDAIRDGAVVGAAVGLIHVDARNAREVRYTRLVDERGAPARVKIEGVAVGDRLDSAHVVLDMDDPSRPSELCAVELTGFA
jgi:hypothetical protein